MLKSLVRLRLCCRRRSSIKKKTQASQGPDSRPRQHRQEQRHTPLSHIPTLPHPPHSTPALPAHCPSPGALATSHHDHACYHHMKNPGRADFLSSMPASLPALRPPSSEKSHTRVVCITWGGRGVQECRQCSGCELLDERWVAVGASGFRANAHTVQSSAMARSNARSPSLRCCLQPSARVLAAHGVEQQRVSIVQGACKLSALATSLMPRAPQP